MMMSCKLFSIEQHAIRAHVVCVPSFVERLACCVTFIYQLSLAVIARHVTSLCCSKVDIYVAAVVPSVVACSRVSTFPTYTPVRAII